MSDRQQDLGERDRSLLLKHRGANGRNWVVALWSLVADRTESPQVKLDRAVELAPDGALLYAGISTLAKGEREHAATFFREFADSLDGGESDE
jgi:hypothetical protein